MKPSAAEKSDADELPRRPVQSAFGDARPRQPSTERAWTRAEILRAARDCGPTAKACIWEVLGKLEGVL